MRTGTKKTILLGAFSIILGFAPCLASAEVIQIAGTCSFSPNSPFHGQMEIWYEYLSLPNVPPNDPRQHKYELVYLQNGQESGVTVVQRTLTSTGALFQSGTIQFAVDNGARLPRGDFRGAYTDGAGTDSQLDCKLKSFFFK